MFCIHLSVNMGWNFRFEKITHLEPIALRCLCSSRCHTGPDVVLQQIKRKGANSNKQVRKTQKKKRPSCPAVLSHFDQQYSRELGDLWPSARAVLLDPQTWQYGVMLNRFSVVTDITQILQSQGFSALLQQTHVSARLFNTPSMGSHSKYQGGKGTLSNHHISKCPSEDSDLRPDITSDGPRQDLQSEPTFSFPCSSLQCYIHSSPLRFPSQPHRPGQLKQYYLLNAASLLPVLALQVRDGDKVLDLCSAPGGKAVAIMQSATPELLCCNEPDPHRRDWLSKTLESFLPLSIKSRVVVSAQDGRAFGQSEAGFYDKVLVDAPCSNDRSWLYSGSIQQGERRLKDRSRLPALQAELLWSALSAVRPGGAVVYSTCTLSSHENQAVVESVLRDFPEAQAEDLWEEIATPLSGHFEFSSHPNHHRLGILVVPQVGKTWGPMFLSRIRRRE
ncbi:tRNA (cytosine(34)-C(5))-methyltransferase, mitochondrial isoform 1-T1 [Menidia menidia]